MIRISRYNRFMKFTLPILAIVFAAMLAPAQAQTEAVKTVYPVVGAPATLQNVLFAAIKHGAVDMKSDQAIDDFARIEYCDIYTKYRSNEFDWRRVRTAMRKKIELDKPNYPDTLYLERTEKIGQYDFSAGMLLLMPDSVIHTRALLLASLKNQNLCNDSIPIIFPERFIALLEKPLIMDGIELTEDEARAVTSGLATITDSKDQRLAYGRYTITLTGAEPISATGPALLDAKIDNVTLYQDAAYSRPFWSGQSSAKSLSQKQGGELDVIPFKGIDTATQKTGLAPKPLLAAPGQ